MGYDKDNEPVYLKDIWPSPKEIAAAIRKAVKPASFKKRYGNVFDGDANWRKVKLVKGQTYQWDIGLHLCARTRPISTACTIKPAPVRGDQGRARAGAVRRHHHHRPHLARRQHQDRPRRAASICPSIRCRQKDFNSYGSRRGNHEVMERGTFANIRIRNEMMGGAEGGNTVYYTEPGRARARPCPSSTPPRPISRTAMARW